METQGGLTVWTGIERRVNPERDFHPQDLIPEIPLFGVPVWSSLVSFVLVPQD